jgi:enoyl-CoA hydratase/carnithine racemase
MCPPTAPSNETSVDAAAAETVLRELREDGVLVLTLNRPGGHNAWDFDMEERYFGLLDEATSDPRVRAVVVTGASGTFCPGMNFRNLQRASSADPTYQRPVRRPQTYALGVPKPVIAAVDGACAGIGFVQALMCDVRFTTARAKWTPSFTRRGLASEDAVTWMLPRLIGAARATELMLSCRVIRGEEAAQAGLAHRCVEPDALLDCAVGWAADVARNCAPWAMAQVKRQLLADAHSTLEEARQRSNEILSLARERPDYAEGVTSFVERRAPSFAALDSGFGRIDPPAAG